MNKTIILSGISLEQTQWNADFTGHARRTNEDKIFATDKARKYAIRQEALLHGENVLLRRRQQENLKFMSLEQILKLGNGGKIINDKNAPEALDKIFRENFDLRVFGFLLTINKVSGTNATGPFQVEYANECYSGETVEGVHDIISFKTSEVDSEKAEEQKANGKEQVEKGTTTIGKEIRIEESALNYVFHINPRIYEDNFRKYAKFDEEMDDTDILNDITANFYSDLDKFKTIINTDVSNTMSCSKVGSNNLYNLIITMKDEERTIDASNLKNVRTEKKDGIWIIDFSRLKTSLENDNILSIQLMKQPSAKVVLPLSLGFKIEIKDI